MKYTLIFTLLAALTSSSLAAPFDLNDLFPGLLKNAAVEQAPEQDVVKRQVLANPDGELKQISFQTLIGDLENSLFQSALSLNGASAPDSQVDEIKPGQSELAESNEHSIAKRAHEVVAAPEVAATPEDAQERKILVQTTKKVPVSEESGPAHLIIDRVSVQPHIGLSVPLIPTFQVHHTKITSATIKEDANNDSSDGKQTKISITKTSITSTAPVESIEAQSTSLNPEVVTSSTTEQATSSSQREESSSSSSSSTTTTTTSTTTEQPLKQVEEKLKEKVAEVEAEPVILTARV
ncbi:probable family 17 glucosidase SCW11 [Drosophila innubila]|uniref:probable family 17 glucosidase SCW11 n=1 Tax=Drosophila innubila TaxID=198719 RepID=UPI00148E00F0|nr:probable family 17 glucosidase SCW11 [Drosophila innubila]